MNLTEHDFEHERAKSEHDFAQNPTSTQPIFIIPTHGVLGLLTNCVIFVSNHGDDKAFLYTFQRIQTNIQRKYRLPRGLNEPDRT